MSNGSNGTALARAGVFAATTTEAWDLVARKVASIAKSTMIPKDYQGNAGNVLIAMEMADRMGLPLLTVMQNLHVIHGRPSWSAAFLIAGINGCGRFSPLRYRFVGEPGTDSWGCYAVAKDKTDGEELVGATITMAMAREEGWSTKAGSKWKTMPEQMLRYRAASFWARAYAPELSVGLLTEHEAEDVAPASGSRLIVAEAPDPDDLNAELGLVEVDAVEAVEEVQEVDELPGSGRLL